MSMAEDFNHKEHKERKEHRRRPKPAAFFVLSVLFVVGFPDFNHKDHKEHKERKEHWPRPKPAAFFVLSALFVVNTLDVKWNVFSSPYPITNSIATGADAPNAKLRAPGELPPAISR
jgi:hypothetical protein